MKLEIEGMLKPFITAGGRWDLEGLRIHLTEQLSTNMAV